MKENHSRLVELEMHISERLKSITAHQPLNGEDEDSVFLATELYNCGYHFYESGKYSEAADFFTLLTQIDAENAKNWKGLGACLQMQNLYHEALLAYATAGVIDTNDPEVFFHAANCCFSLDHISEGLMALETAENIAKNKPNCDAMIQQFTTLREIWSNEEKTEKCLNL